MAVDNGRKHRATANGNLSPYEAVYQLDVTLLASDDSVVAASDEGGNLLWRKAYAPYREQIGSDQDDEALSTRASCRMPTCYYVPVVGPA